MNGQSIYFCCDIFLWKTVSSKNTIWYPISYICLFNTIYFCVGWAWAKCFSHGSAVYCWCPFKNWKMKFCNMSQYFHHKCYEIRSAWPVITTTATQKNELLYIIHHFPSILLLLTASSKTNGKRKNHFQMNCILKENCVILHQRWGRECVCARAKARARPI